MSCFSVIVQQMIKKSKLEKIRFSTSVSVKESIKMFSVQQPDPFTSLVHGPTFHIRQFCRQNLLWLKEPKGTNAPDFKGTTESEHAPL